MAKLAPPFLISFTPKLVVILQGWTLPLPHLEPAVAFCVPPRSSTPFWKHCCECQLQHRTPDPTGVSLKNQKPSSLTLRKIFLHTHTHILISLSVTGATGNATFLPPLLPKTLFSHLQVCAYGCLCDLESDQLALIIPLRSNSSQPLSLTYFPLRSSIMNLRKLWILSKSYPYPALAETLHVIISQALH